MGPTMWLRLTPSPMAMVGTLPPAAQKYPPAPAESMVAIQGYYEHASWTCSTCLSTGRVGFLQEMSPVGALSRGLIGYVVWVRTINLGRDAETMNILLVARGNWRSSR